MAVDNIPTPRSFPQVLGEMIDAVTSRIGIRRLRVGGPFLSILEAAGQSDVRNSQDLFNLLESQDLDNSEGIALDRIGNDEDTPRFLLNKSTGTITISDGSFAKISTKVYQGAAAPIVGSVALNVENAESFPTSGNVYVGRNTPNIEGPLTYATKTNNGAFWTLNLSTPTTRFHNKGEGVVLAQGGNRSIDAGTAVATAQGALQAAVQFSTVFDTRIPDGEVEVIDVQVICTVEGAIGNVPAESVKEFVGGGPFPGAAVINDKPFISGRDTETNNDYRNRIRNVRNSKQRGTDLAIETAVLGIVSPDENKRVSSAVVVRRRDEPSVLYIDDGSGYEEISQGVGIEVALDSALGGEVDLQTIKKPIVKAFLVSANSSSFSLSDGAKLSIRVGGVVYTHAFDSSEFTSISAASAYEISASINADPFIEFSARTAGSGTKVVIIARTQTNEDIAVVPVIAPDTDANNDILLPSSRRFTTLLYHNDRLLNKDGLVASLRSNEFSIWNTFSGNQTLTISIDQTPAVTYTFSDSDFIDNNTAFTGVGKNSLEAWVTVVNHKIPGVHATIEGARLVLTSNIGRDGTAALAITGGTLVSNLVFVTSSAVGGARDYALDRGTGQIFLEHSAATGDRYTLGSIWTRAFLETPIIIPTTLSSNGKLWFTVDGNPQIISHGVGSAMPLTATVEQILDHGLRIRITVTSTTEVFTNVQRGDWMILWDPDVSIPDVLRRAWRVTDTELDGSSNRNIVVLEKRAANAPRLGSAAVTLTPPGTLSKVLAVGGYTFDAGSGTAAFPRRQGRGTTEHCEVFDPTDGTWTEVKPMGTPRAHHTATLLNSGMVLVVGGYDFNGVALDTTEIYDSVGNTWTAGPVLAAARSEHTATLLASGRVLIAGGWNGSAALSSSVEYDPVGNNFINGAVMVTARYGHSTIRLPTGAGVAGVEQNNVLVAGGHNTAGTKLLNVERYSFGGFSWAARASLPSTRSYFGLDIASTQKVVAAGDCDPQALGVQRQAKFTLYDPSADSWTADANISQVGGTDIFFSDKKLARTFTSGLVLALYAKKVPAVGRPVLAHVQFNDGTDLWDLRTASTFSNLNTIERCETLAVPFTSSGATDKVLVYAGSSVGNVVPANRLTAVATATSEIFDAGGNSWTAPDNSTALSGGMLSSRGLVFIRTLNDLQVVEVVAGTNYTSPTFADALNLELIGATASVYRTSRLRVSTNSFALDRDILLAASNIATLLPIPVGEVEHNLVGHLASTESGPGVGTPDDFQVFHVLYAATPHIVDSARDLLITEFSDATFFDELDEPPNSGSTVVGLRRWHDGLNPTYWEANYPSTSPDLRIAQYGNSKNFRTHVATMEVQGTFNTSTSDRIRIGLRNDPQAELVPHHPLVFSMPFAIGPNDDFAAVIDGDTDTKRFSTAMFRKVKPATATYGSQIALLDVDGGNAPLARAFGIDYNFNDFAIYMKARVKTHSADDSRRILWRYFRHGAEGNYSVLRYVYPTTPNANVTVTTIYDQTDIVHDLGGPSRISIDVGLNSGAARTGSNIHTGARLGLARCSTPATGAGVFETYVLLGFHVVSAERPLIGGQTKLTLQVPNNGIVAQGPQDIGLIAGQTVWFEAASPTPTTLFSGAFAIASVDPFNIVTGQQAIYVPGSTLDDGTSALPVTADPGTISFDSHGEQSFDATIADGDLIILNGSNLPAAYTNTTMRITSHGYQFLRCFGLDLTSAGVQTTPSWSIISNVPDISIFAGPNRTATQIATDVNTLAAGTTSTCPVTTTVTGNGTGQITFSTWNEFGIANSKYALVDGLNHVQRTIDPPNINTDTEFLLRDPVDSTLGTNGDWTNEDVRLAPILPDGVARWLNTPAVSGLFTAAEIRTSAEGTKVQIASLTPGSVGSVEIQGGTANGTAAAVFGAAQLITRNSPARGSFLVTVRRAEAAGIVGRSWVSIDNTFTLPKVKFWSSGTAVSSIDTTGLWTFSIPPYGSPATFNNIRLHVEKIGPWVALHVPNISNSSQINFGAAQSAGYVYVTTATGAPVSDLSAVASPNRGVFRILRVSRSHLGVTLWVENASAVEEVSLCKLKLLAPKVPVPGDTWNVSTTRFGSANKAIWKITEIGTATPGSEQYTNNTFRVDVTSQLSQALGTSTTFSTDVDLVQLRQGTASRTLKKVMTVAPHPTDGAYIDLVFNDTDDSDLVGAAAGSVVNALDKLSFPPGTFIGVDGYGFATGLVGEANRIVYGDPEDPATYPGFAANGASIVVSGPLVKRVKVALALRIQSGLSSDDLADRVRSAVASVINQTGIGQAIAISDIVEAAGSVTGVIAVSVVKPNFTSTSDLIPVGSNEKPLVLDLHNDITISFVGE